MDTLTYAILIGMLEINGGVCNQGVKDDGTKWTVCQDSYFKVLMFDRTHLDEDCFSMNLIKDVNYGVPYHKGLYDALTGEWTFNTVEEEAFLYGLELAIEKERKEAVESLKEFLEVNSSDY